MVGQIVHQDETPGQPVVLVRVVEEGSVRGQGYASDFVQHKTGNVDFVQGIDVDAVVDVVDAHAGGLCGLLDQVVTRRVHGRLAHPDHHGFEPPVHVGQVLGMDDHVATAHVHLVLQLQRNGHGRIGLIEVAVETGHGLHPRPVLPGQDQHFIPGPDHAGQHRSRVVPRVLVGADDVLHGEAQVHQVAVGKELHVLQDIQHGLPMIPRHAAALLHHVVAEEGAHRNEPDVAHVQLGGVVQEDTADIVEDRFAEIHHVHLVHGDDEVLDAEQRGDEGVAAGLRQHAVARVDEHDRQVGAGRAGRHVPGVLFVAGGVGDDELPLRRREIAVGHVDGDALLPLGLEAVQQQGQIGRFVLAGHLPERGEVVLVDVLRVGQEPADQRGLAVVHAARRAEAQQFLFFVLG